MKSLVNSVIQYMIVLWGETTIKNLKKIENAIRSMARFVTGKGKYDSISEEITELEWLYPKLQYEFKVLCLCLTFKLVKCGNIEAFNNYYKRVSETHGFPTSNANKLSISNYQFKGSYGFGTFHYKSIQYWNKLPQEIESLNSYAKFKTQTKISLLERQKEMLKLNN